MFTNKTLFRILKNANVNIKHSAIKTVRLFIVLHIPWCGCKIFYVFYGSIDLQNWREISRHITASISPPDSENRFCPYIMRITLKSFLNRQEKRANMVVYLEVKANCLLCHETFKASVVFLMTFTSNCTASRIYSVKAMDISLWQWN